MNNIIWIIFLITGSVIAHREYKRILEKNSLTTSELRRLLWPYVTAGLIAVANKFIVSVIMATILYAVFHRFLWYTDVLSIVFLTNLWSVYIHRLIKKYI